jgi:putative pyruvate formate lyase activating enzyme
MASSRREFITGCLMVVGGSALGLARCAREHPWQPAPNQYEEGGARAARRMQPQVPAYLELERSGELARREEALWAMLGACRLCPRECGADRLAGRTGVCSSGGTFKVASYGPHFGEEAPLVGRYGSGTIFFSNCNLLCVYCQNWEINHRGDGEITSHRELARKMLALQARGCHNVNLVTPTHLMPHIVRALRLAIREGLRLPLVYNTGGYDSLEVIRLLGGVVDIYLPDFKYQDAEIAARFSNGAPDYPLHAAAVIAEMHRQVGALDLEGGVAVRGLLIRHLVLPGNLAGTDRFVKWVVEELGPDTAVNLMAQYRPMHRAREYPPLDRALTREEWAEALRWAGEAGLRPWAA